MRPIVRAAGALGALVLLTGAAADPADRLADPAKEARAHALFDDVRCLVCQSESIDESEAPLAHDLRQLIRQQVAAGRSDAEIRAFLVRRYGEFVLLTPRPSLGNAVLWAGPLVVVLAGLSVLILRRRKGGATDGEALSVEEEAALAKLTRDQHV
ncbi:MAG: cytochrome c-type biogenesis protein [Caulobacterales bacterium]